LPVLLKEFFDQIFGFRGHFVPWFKRKVWGVLNSLSGNFLVFFVIEWKNSTQEKVSDDTKRPEINFFTVWLLKQNLWSDVRKGTERI